MAARYAADVPRALRGERAGSNEISSLVPVALARRRSVDKLGAAFPLSRRAIVDWEVPIFEASSA